MDNTSKTSTQWNLFNMDTLGLSILYVYNLKSQKRSSDKPVLFHQPTNIQAKQIIRIIIIITKWLVLFYKNVTTPLLIPRLGLGSNCSRQHCIANNLVEGYLISYTPWLPWAFFSPGRILWPTGHEKSLAPKVHHSLNFRIPDSPKSSRSFLMIKNRRSAGESEDWYQPLCSLWSRALS